MKPIIVLPKGAMSPENVDQLRANDMCVVETDDPAAVKFLDPIPSVMQRSKVEEAAIQLSRKVLSGLFNGTYPLSRAELCVMYVECLVRGTPLSKEPSQQEMEQKAYDEARLDEKRRIAREDARAEAAEKRATAAAAKAAKKQTT